MPLWNLRTFPCRRTYSTEQLSSNFVKPYTELIRLEKPIGSWLLFWPGAWSIAMACQNYHDPLNWKLLALFGVGSVVMRGAGCTINDLWDKRLDRLVDRTKDRPLAAGKLTTLQALTFLGGQLSVGLVILLQLNWTSVALGASSLLPVIFYPLMKRVTYWPQFVLGLTFNWGALLGWTAHTGHFDLSIMAPLYVAGICWTMVYDTIYALQDIHDDIQVNIKSTAIRFGDNVKIWLAAFATTSIVAFTYTGIQAGMGPFYYIGVGGAALHYMWQIGTLKKDDVADCLRKFKSNRWLGALVFGGIILDFFHDRFAGGVAEFLTLKPSL